jgi:hypothetical protein
MNRSIGLVVLASVLSTACQNASPLEPEVDQIPEAAAPALATSLVSPTARVRALAWNLEVEILPSNSDFVNHIWLVSPHEVFVGTDDELGRVTALPPIWPFQELIFEIRVHDPAGLDTGVRWQTGPGRRNADGQQHAMVEYMPRRVIQVNFEDIAADGWGQADEPNFVDAVFAVRPAGW